MAKNNIKEEVIKEGKIIKEEVSKKEVSKENRQLYWFFGIIIFVFVVFLLGYLYYENYVRLPPEGYRVLDRFEYEGISWQEEDYVDFIAYHGRFKSFLNANNTHNIFLRQDPRENNVPVTGNLTSFRFGGFISTSSEIDQCKGDMVGDLLTLVGFLRYGVGMTSVELGTTDMKVAKETNRTFADCNVWMNRGVIAVKLGNESSIVQSDKNPFCYTITVKDCDDIAPVEKFMIETVRQKAEK